MNAIFDIASTYFGAIGEKQFDNTYLLFEEISGYISSHVMNIGNNFKYMFEILFQFIISFHISYNLIYIIIIFTISLTTNIYIFRKYIIRYYEYFRGINDIALSTCIMACAMISGACLQILNKIFSSIFIVMIEYTPILPNVDYTLIGLIHSIIGSLTWLYSVWFFTDYIVSKHKAIKYIKYILLTSTIRQILLNSVILLMNPLYKFTIAADQMYGLIILSIVLFMSSYLPYANFIYPIACLMYCLYILNPSLMNFIIWCALTYIIIRSCLLTISKIYNKSSILYKKYLFAVKIHKVPEAITKYTTICLISLLSYYIYKLNTIKDSSINVFKQIVIILNQYSIIKILTIWIISGTILWSIYASIDNTLEIILYKLFPHRSERYIQSIVNFLRSILLAIISFISLSVILLSIGYHQGLTLISLGLGSGIFFGGKIFFENLVSSFMTLSNNKLLEGDIIEVLGRTGKIEDITLFTIHLRLPDGGLFIIPFNKIDQITNKSRTLSISSILYISLTTSTTLDVIENIVEYVNKSVKKSVHMQYMEELKYHGIDKVSNNYNIYLIYSKVISDQQLQENISRFLLSEMLIACRKFNINVVELETSIGPVYS